jgi:NTP pyrophosphatase (non-canonical NTP hydrolase)
MRGMTFAEVADRALRVRQRYAEIEQARYGRRWTAEEVALGFVGDVGDLAKLVLAAAGVREIPEHRGKLGHELADCLWSVLVLAHLYQIDLEREFVRTMDMLEEHLASPASDAVRSEMESASGFLCRSIDRIVGCLDGLEPDAATWRPPAPGANSLLGIAAHVLANAEENVLGVVAGQPVDRQREGELADDQRSAEAVREQWRALRPRLHAALVGLTASEMESRRVHPRRGDMGVRDVLLVAVRHAAEHMGQAELTRDLLRAEMARSAPTEGGG